MDNSSGFESRSPITEGNWAPCDSDVVVRVTEATAHANSTLSITQPKAPRVSAGVKLRTTVNTRGGSYRLKDRSGRYLHRASRNRARLRGSGEDFQTAAAEVAVRLGSRACVST